MARSWLALIAVVCAACSAVVDFPEKAPTKPEERLDGGDAGGGGNGNRDARVADADAQQPGRNDGGGDARVDSAMPPGGACTSNDACMPNELCCGADGAKQCDVVSAVVGCTACGEACTSERAPNCGNRTCECVKDSGQACAAGQLCIESNGVFACAECATNNDCTEFGNRPLCAAGKCVQCDRATSGNAGCTGTTPICSTQNTCVGCDDSNPETKCPGDLVCSPGLGCGGCKLDAPDITTNGCAGGPPICKVIAGLQQCGGCTADADCKYPTKTGYCVSAGGTCSETCDPDIGAPANGCAAANAPFCKANPAVAGTYSCQPCGATDCTGGTFCAIDGPLAGACVQCRNSSDCPQGGLSPVCDAASFTCRPRNMNDCAATPETPILDGTNTCVQCTNNTHCAQQPAGQQICNSTTRKCGQCSDSSQCPAATPTCDVPSSTCVAGCTPQLCTAAHGSDGPYCNQAGTQCVQCIDSANCSRLVPICSDVGTCVRCTDLPGPTGSKDAKCNDREGGTACVTGGVFMGVCEPCDPERDEAFCPGAASECQPDESTLRLICKAVPPPGP